MKQAVEYFQGLCYKISIFDISCDNPTFVYGDNQSVLANISVPDSTLKNNPKPIAFHLVQECCMHDEWSTKYVNTHENPEYLLTNPLPSGEEWWSFVRMFLYWL